jgi:putative peptide zinc metalloprotease protein
VQAQITREEIEGVEARLARKREALRDLDVRAPVDGTLIVPNARDLPGRYVAQGSLLAYVLTEDPVTVRVAVPQAEADLVRQRTRRVDVRPVEDLDHVTPARVAREVPSASQELPSAALGTAGGGPIAIDPRNESGKTAFENVFLFDLELPRETRAAGIGSRAYVRFGHGLEPIAFRWYRGLWQLFLSRLAV